MKGTAMKMITISAFLIISLLLHGCGGGGGDGAEEPPQTAAVFGALIVPPSHSVEAELNNTIDDSQQVTPVTQISGHASVSDAGFEPPGLPGTTVQDLYLLDADEAVRIVLTIAEDDPGSNDLDLVLMTEEGDVIETSEGKVAIESLDTSQAGTFVVGVRAAGGSSAYLLSFEPLGILAARVAGEPTGAEFVPGEILVKLKQAPAATAEARTILEDRFGMHPLGHYPGGVALMAIDQKPTGEDLKTPLLEKSSQSAREVTLERIRQLRSDPAIEYAEPNFIRYFQRIPNDEFYDLQWHHSLINLPKAWDVTNGDDDVVVAVLDTGVFPDHPDLASRIGAGFDFISDPTRANDGDGIDPDFTDAGDDPAKESSSFHGTHTAGLLGAATDNQQGVAGTTWFGGLMMLRVLGVGGGTDADIAQAIRFAAGLDNVSGTVPDQPADAINMSFGSSGFSQTVNDAVQAARGAGVTIVASAGNGNNSDPFYPASYSGVLSVSAVDLNSQKASYSNFGPQIDLAAPGGDSRFDLNGDGHPDGVLSTSGDDFGEPFYLFLSGTSMAAPHVTGAIALMKSIYPQLTPSDVDQLIAGDHPDTSIQIVRNLGEEGRDDLFGHGLIDANLAVQAAVNLAGGEETTVSGPELNLSTTVIDFQDFLTTATFEITNGGTGTLTVDSIREDGEWLTVTPTSGTAPLTVTMTVDRRDLAAGAYQAAVTIDSDATEGNQSSNIEVMMTVGNVALGNIGPTFVVAIDHATQEAVVETQTDFGEEYLFTLPSLDPGTYLIAAGTDRDGDGIICDIEDACGTYSELITVETGEDVGPLEFPVGASVPPQSFSISRVPAP